MQSSKICYCLVAFITCIWSHESVNPLNPNQQEEHVHGAVDPQQKANGGSNVPSIVHENRVPPPAHGGHGQGNAPRHPSMMDKEHVHDQEHIMEHLDGKINKEQKMTDEELQFHYFKVHDYDNNDMLDGIELISALSHHNRAEAKDGMSAPRDMSDADLANAIDDILNENDANGNGYVDYPEFVMAQRGANV